MNFVLNSVGNSVGFSATSSHYQQKDILKNIELLGNHVSRLNENDVSADGYMEKFENALRHNMSAINQASDREKTSDLFGGAVTTREENLYLLMTVIDSRARVTPYAKAYLLDIVCAELGV